MHTLLSLLVREKEEQRIPCVRVWPSYLFFSRKRFPSMLESDLKVVDMSCLFFRLHQDKSMRVDFDAQFMNLFIRATHVRIDILEFDVVHVPSVIRSPFLSVKNKILTHLKMYVADIGTLIAAAVVIYEAVTALHTRKSIAFSFSRHKPTHLLQYSKLKPLRTRTVISSQQEDGRIILLL